MNLFPGTLSAPPIASRPGSPLLSHNDTAGVGLETPAFLNLIHLFLMPPPMPVVILPTATLATATVPTAALLTDTPHDATLPAVPRPPIRPAAVAGRDLFADTPPGEATVRVPHHSATAIGAAAPVEIAEALIRRMLGTPVPGRSMLASVPHALSAPPMPPPLPDADSSTPATLAAAIPLFEQNSLSKVTPPPAAPWKARRAADTLVGDAASLIPPLPVLPGAVPPPTSTALLSVGDSPPASKTESKQIIPKGGSAPAGVMPTAFAVCLSPREPQDTPDPPTAQVTVKRESHAAVLIPLKDSHAPSVLTAEPAQNLTSLAPLPAAEAAGRFTAPPPAVASAAPAATPPSTPEPPASASGVPLKEMTFRVTPAATSPVDVQVNQRQGHVFVAVRTADPGLQTALRQELPQLVRSLDRAGFHAETFVPQIQLDGVRLGGVQLDAAVRALSESSAGGMGRDGSSPDTGPDTPGFYQNQQQQQQRQREQMHHKWRDSMED